MQGVFAPSPGGHHRHSKYPRSLHVSISIMLYAQFQMGIPLTSSLALPLTIGVISNSGHAHAHLLHSGQTAFPIPGTLRSNGLQPEEGKMFWTKRAVNHFFQKIGMSVRSSTGCFNKKRTPDQLDAHRKTMTLRLLYIMVTKTVPRCLLFQSDETGTLLLPMPKRGRAEKGVEEVKTHGADEKRQVTCTPIIDGENNLVKPTQVIWGGEEFTTDRVTKEKTNTPATGACPKPHVADMCKERLWHCQTKSHWCTLNSLKMLVHALAAHAVLKMVERGLDPAEQCWVFIIDCYSVHISREFLEWARFTYPNMFLLYIFAGCTAWLQPLDISFNGVFKSILRQEASLWLCQYMQDQLQLNGGDPSNLGHIGPHPHISEASVLSLAVQCPFSDG